MSRRVLVVSTALAEAFAAMVEDDRVLAEQRFPGGRGLVEHLPAMIAGVIKTVNFDLIAAVVGPGSFTGIRAGLALAHGLSLGSGCPLVGVTAGEAVRQRLGWSGALWVATDAHRDGIFLEGDGAPRSVPLSALALPGEMPLLAGDQADKVAERLTALGGSARVADLALADAIGIAGAARARLSGRLESLACLPLYIDAPEVSRPASAVRPPPR